MLTSAAVGTPLGLTCIVGDVQSLGRHLVPSGVDHYGILGWQVTLEPGRKRFRFTPLAKHDSHGHRMGRTILPRSQNGVSLSAPGVLRPSFAFHIPPFQEPEGSPNHRDLHLCRAWTGRSYSLNEAREPDWPDGLRRYIHDMKTGAGWSREKFDLVYVCSLVADVHYTLFEGGIAMNPR